MGRKRKSHTAEFKAKVALAALKGDRTTNEVAGAYEVHPTRVNEWRRQLLANAQAAFAGAKAAQAADPEALQAPLFEEIGRLKVELDWLKKKAASLG